MGVKVSKGLEEVGVKLVELGPRIKMQVLKNKIKVKYQQLLKMCKLKTH